MILLALFLGVVLIASAIRGNYADLFAALSQDVPGFVVWGAALFAVGVIGFIPGLKPVSRGLMALVIVVIVLNNYQKILDGFKAGVDDAGKSPTAVKPGAPNATASQPSFTGGVL